MEPQFQIRLHHKILLKELQVIKQLQIPHHLRTRPVR